MQDDKANLIDTEDTRQRLGGVSNMFIYRKLKDDPDFPRPVRFAPNGRRFWYLAEIDEYIASKRVEA